MLKVIRTPLPEWVFFKEFLGTLILTTAIRSTATAAVLHRTIAGGAPDSSSIYQLAAITLAVLVLIGKECHYNAGLTVGAAMAKQISWSEVPKRCLAQLLGALTSSLLTWAYFGTAGKNVAHLGASLPEKGASTFDVLLVEFVFSLMFYAFVLWAAPKASLPLGYLMFGIGAALGGAIFLAGPISGGSINPVIDFAPMLVSLVFTDWPVYILAPLAAGLLAGFVMRKHTAAEQIESDKPTYLRDADQFD